jgi:hypothetical protein
MANALAVYHRPYFAQDALGWALHRHFYCSENGNRDSLKDTLRRTQTLARGSAPVLGGEFTLYCLREALPRKLHGAKTLETRQTRLPNGYRRPLAISFRAQKWLERTGQEPVPCVKFAVHTLG